MLSSAEAHAAIELIRRATSRPLNLNFFCHTPPQPDMERDARWRARLAPYYKEFGLAEAASAPTAGRAAFDDGACRLVEETRPEVVSFHFGLPPAALLARVKAAGSRVIGSATTVAEAQFLEAQGCDAVIAMGVEAGGHRGNFLTNDMATQIGTFALVPQVADAVRVPVIAAGGVADGRGIAAAMMLGASAVQIGTAYLLTSEAAIPASHREALLSVRDDGTALTNVFTGRPARGIINRLVRDLGPMAPDVPAFPTAAAALTPLRAVSPDFRNQWAGQYAAALSRAVSSFTMTQEIAAQALRLLGR